MEQAKHRLDYHNCSGFEEGTVPVTDQERLNRIRLIRTDNVGRITFHQLIERFGSATRALEELPELSRQGGAVSLQICPEKKAERELQNAERINARLVCFDEPDYPSLLLNVDYPPPLLYLTGQKELLARPIISIVGSRNGSAAGKQITRNIATDLAALGYVIASGLARGIDTAAHEATLESGTIAVVAGGPDMLYPPENADLQRTIGKQGLIISENPPGFKPRGKDFPRRNRIISGLAHAVLVMEAALKSGSLITARYALEQGREVFAVPGNPLDPRATGSNQLIKNGAAMLTSADDVTEVLAPMIRSLPLYMKPEQKTSELPLSTMEQPSTPTTANRKKILLALGPTPTDVDELIRCTGLTAGEIHMVLMELDLAGRLERHGRQKVSLINSHNQGSLF